VFFFSHQHFFFFWFKRFPREIFLKHFLRTKFSIFSWESFFFKHIPFTLFLGPLNIRCSNILLAFSSQTFFPESYSLVFFSILLLKVFLAPFGKYFPQHPVHIYFISKLPSNNSPATYSQTFSQYIFPCYLFSGIFISNRFSKIFLMLLFSNTFFSIFFSNIFLVLLFSNIFSASFSQISSSCYCSQTFFQHPFLKYLPHVIVLKHFFSASFSQISFSCYCSQTFSSASVFQKSSSCYCSQTLFSASFSQISSSCYRSQTSLILSSSLSSTSRNIHLQKVDITASWFQILHRGNKLSIRFT